MLTWSVHHCPFPYIYTIFHGYSLMVLGELCLICPFKSLINKYAFNPPEPPTYNFIEKGERLLFQLFDDSFEIMFENLSQKITAFFIKPEAKIRIACMIVRSRIYTPSDAKNPLILLSHGNSSDLGVIMPFLISLSNHLHVDILSYDYPGYGQSSGRPNEVGLKKSVEYVFERALEMGYTLEEIIVYGQSIGSVPSIHLASKYKIGALVIHSGLLSGIKLICRHKRIRCGLCDIFKNDSKIKRVTSPTLVIHGIDDDVIPCSHGKQLFENLLHPLEPLFIIGAGHNNVETFPEYLLRMQRFINAEIPVNPRRTNGLQNQSSTYNERYSILPICNEDWPNPSKLMISVDKIDSGLEPDFIKPDDEIMPNPKFINPYKQREISWMCSSTSQGAQ